MYEYSKCSRKKLMPRSRGNPNNRYTLSLGVLAGPHNTCYACVWGGGVAPGAYMYIYTPYNHTHTYARTYKYIYVGICCFYALFICFRGYHAICINCPNPLIYFTLLICLNTFPHDTVAVAFESPPFLHRHRACHSWNRCNGICPAFVYYTYIRPRNQT